MFPSSKIPDFSSFNKEQLDLIYRNSLLKAGRKLEKWVEMQRTGDYSGGSPMSEDGELPAGAENIPDLHIDGEPDDNILDGVEALVGASSPIVVRDDSPMEISTPPPAPAPAPIPLSSPPSLPPLTPTSLLSRSRFKEGKAVRATPPFVSEEDKAKIDEAYRALNASSGKGCNRTRFDRIYGPNKPGLFLQNPPCSRCARARESNGTCIMIQYEDEGFEYCARCVLAGHVCDLFPKPEKKK